MPHLEYAKSSQGKCWKCSGTISEGTLRLQTSVGGHSGYGSDPGFGPKKWMHLRCYRPNKRVDWNWFRGTGVLDQKDKERLEKLIKQWNDRPAVGGPGLLKKATTKEKKVKEPTAPTRKSTRVRKTLHTPQEEESDSEAESSNKKRKSSKKSSAPKAKKAKIVNDQDDDGDAADVE